MKNKNDMIDIIKLPFNHYLKLIKDNKPFSFSRFNDGEVLSMFNVDFFKNKRFHDNKFKIS
jgi:hypothetical protein